MIKEFACQLHVPQAVGVEFSEAGLCEEGGGEVSGSGLGGVEGSVADFGEFVAFSTLAQALPHRTQDIKVGDRGEGREPQRSGQAG